MDVPRGHETNPPHPIPNWGGVRGKGCGGGLPVMDTKSVAESSVRSPDLGRVVGPGWGSS